MATFKVFRYNPSALVEPHFDSFEVPSSGTGMTVLEGLYYILENLDPSLAFRSACRAAICGSCAMHINGQYRLACRTRVEAFKGRPVVVQPMLHMKHEKDLVVDMDPFWEHFKAVKPYLIAASEEPEKEFRQSPRQRKKLDPWVDCILCGCCFSSCPFAGSDPNYLGPHSFVWALRFANDSRDTAKKERLGIVGNNEGVFRCHTVFNCQQVCPKSLDVTGAISKLKVKSIGLRLFGK
jgi:succinate dehydrogenase / fumarate reductase iron-sulfur subunit